MGRLSFVEEAPPTPRRTLIWSAWSGEVYLGDIAWYAPWRRYAYYPTERRVLDAECLTEITTVCAERTQEHDAVARAKRSGERLCPTCGLPSSMTFHPIVGPARRGENHCGACGSAMCPRDCW